MTAHIFLLMSFRKENVLMGWELKKLICLSSYEPVHLTPLSTIRIRGKNAPEIGLSLRVSKIHGFLIPLLLFTILS